MAAAVANKSWFDITRSKLKFQEIFPFSNIDNSVCKSYQTGHDCEFCPAPALLCLCSAAAVAEGFNKMHSRFCRRFWIDF